MNNKFEEAIYIRNDKREMYSVEDITELRSDDPQQFHAIKGYLFCPECEIPHLSHKLCSNKEDYFSTYPREFHDDTCSYVCNKADVNVLNAVNENPSLSHINNRLNDCILMLLEDQNVESNPFILDRNNDNKILRVAGINNVVEDYNYYIPRKRLTKYMDISCAKDFMIFYGKVIMKWTKAKHDKGYYPHILRIYHLNEKRLICSLKFSKNVYAHLPDESKGFDENAEFIRNIAFYTKLSANYKKESKVVGNTFFDGVISDSRKIVFRNIVEVNRT